MAKAKLFNVGDYVTLGIAGLMSGFGFLGLGFADAPVAKIISGVTGGLALAFGLFFAIYWRLVPYLRQTKRKVTKHGMFITNSEKTRDFNYARAEKLTEWLLSHFHKTMGWDKSKMLDICDGVVVDIEDVEYFEIQQLGKTVKAKGYTIIETKYSRLATLPKEGNNSTPMQITESLFKHEVGHTIAGYMDAKYMDQEASHQLFKNTELGA